MAKALKIGAMVVGGVALLATGVGAVALGGLAGSLTVAGISSSTLLLTSSGLAIGSSLLQKAPSVPKTQVDRLNASVDPRAFRKTALGSTALATDVRYIEWFGKDQERCGWIVAHASHAIDGVDEIWLDDELAWTAAGGTQGKFRDYFWVRRVITEGSAANAFSFGSGRWNGSRRLTGCAYSFLEFKVTGNGKKADGPFVSGIPTRISAIGRGAKLYDPRRDSTVPGGSGPMRADDQSTWRYTTDDGAVIGENVALQILRLLLGWRINGKLATGSGVPPRRLDFASFALAANLCDERVNRSAGGTEPRYQAAGVVSEGDDPKEAISVYCTACCGRFRDAGGKLSLVIMHNDLAAAATDPGLGDDDVIGGFTWDPDPSLEATPNIVRGQYVDASSASLYQLVPYPDVTLESLDGIDRVLSIDFGVVESPSQVQRIGKQTLQRKQYQRRFAAPFDIVAWRYNVGDVVPFTYAPLGFRRKLFRVVETDPGSNPCNLVLEEESPAIYAWDADDSAPVRAAEPLVYNKGNNPLILAIGEAATTAEWPNVSDPDGTRPENGATKGAPAGTLVFGRKVEEVISDLDINGQNYFDLVGLTANRDAYLRAQLTLDGLPLGTVISDVSKTVSGIGTETAESYNVLGARIGDVSAGLVTLRQTMVDSLGATAQQLAVVSSRFGDTTALVTQLQTTFAGLDKAVAQSFEDVSASLGDMSGSVTRLSSVVLGPDGPEARAVLSLNANGQLAGIVATNTGKKSALEMVFGSYNLLTPSGKSILFYSDPAQGGDGQLYLQDIVVQKVTYGALVPLFRDRQQLDPNGWYQELPGGMIMMGGRYRQQINREVSLSIVFPKPFPNQVLSVGVVPHLNTFSAFRDLWLQTLGEPTKQGFTCQTQAATSDNMTLDGFDWWAWGN